MRVPTSGVRVHTRMVLRPHPRVPAVTLSTPASPQPLPRPEAPPGSPAHARTHARTSPQSRCLTPSARASSVGTCPLPSLGQPHPHPQAQTHVSGPEATLFLRGRRPHSQAVGLGLALPAFPSETWGSQPPACTPGARRHPAGWDSELVEREGGLESQGGGVSWKPCGRGRASGPSPEEGRPQAEQQPPGQGPGATPRPRPPVAQIRPAAVHIDL